MKETKIKTPGKDSETIQADCAFMAVPAGQFKKKLGEYLDNFDGKICHRPRQLIRAQSDPEPGTIIQTAAPQLKAGRISWLCLSDPQEVNNKQELKSQLELGFSFLEEKNNNVILLREPEIFKLYPVIDHYFDFIKEFITNFSTSVISRVKIENNCEGVNS